VERGRVSDGKNLVAKDYGGKMKRKIVKNHAAKSILGTGPVCRILYLVLTIILFQVGCKSLPILSGYGVDLTLLGGEWQGDYYSKETGRSGTLEFRLTAGKDKAYGDVIMIPRGSEKPYRPAGSFENPEASLPHPEVPLSISFVKVVGGKVSGELTPYWDPDMQRILFTTFEGSLMGDTLEGTFESRIEQSPIYFFGQWKVARKR
jgi:hypothetical protein